MEEDEYDSIRQMQGSMRSQNVAYCEMMATAQKADAMDARRPLSTRNLAVLRELAHVERAAQSIAVLDAILIPDWEYRYFSFNAEWDVGRRERMASMRDGSGDHYFAVFSPAGGILKGFAHEAAMSPWASDRDGVWAGVLDHVPPVFAEFLSEPAFSISETTFCVWRLANDDQWHCGEIEYPAGEDPDGSESLLRVVGGDAAVYRDFAEECYDLQVQTQSVQRIFEHTPMTAALARTLNHGIVWDDLQLELTEIGYPIG